MKTKEEFAAMRQERGDLATGQQRKNQSAFRSRAALAFKRC